MLSKLVLAACLAALSSAAYQEQACTDANGQCQENNLQCSGDYRNQLCPTQAANVLCCVVQPRQEQACANLRGTCQNQYKSCPGGYRNQACPTQAAFIKCCLPGGQGGSGCSGAACVQEVPVPPEAFNQPVSYMPTTVIQGHFGVPCRTSDGVILSRRLAPHMQVVEMGPFRAYGFRPFLELLRNAFNKVRQSNNGLYNRLGHGGTFNCRNIAGTNRFSNHAFGAAMDVQIDGRYDPYNNGLTFRGLIEIHRASRDEGLYWGAAFPNEDSMHFEISEQKFRQLVAQGRI